MLPEKGWSNMTLTIYEGFDKSYVIIGSKDERFTKAWGQIYRAYAKNLYKDLANLSAWCNNELGEECLFEVD